MFSGNGATVVKRQTDRQLLTYYTVSSASWAKSWWTKDIKKRE